MNVIMLISFFLVQLAKVSILKENIFTHYHRYSCHLKSQKLHSNAVNKN